MRTSIAAGTSEAHLCAAWLPAASAAVGGGGGKASAAAAAASSAPTLLAIGTASGDVAAYDTATAELRWRALGVNEGGVSCLAASAAVPAPSGKRAAAAAAANGFGNANANAARPARLVSCGADAVVASLDPLSGMPAPFAAPAPAPARAHANGGGAANGTPLPSPASGSAATTFRGSKHPVTAAALSADGGRALVGASTLALWDLAPPSGGRPRRLCKLTGHPLPVRAAAFSPGAGHHALTAARGERGVSVWRASAEALGLAAAAAAALASPPSAGGGGGRRASRGSDAGGGGAAVVAAAANLATDDEAVQLSTCAAAGAASAAGTAFFAAAVGEGGGCAVWRVAAAGGPAGAVEVVAQARLRVSGGGESILAAHLEPTAGEGEKRFCSADRQRRRLSLFFGWRFAHPRPWRQPGRAGGEHAAGRGHRNTGPKHALKLFSLPRAKRILTREGGRNAARDRPLCEKGRGAARQKGAVSPPRKRGPSETASPPCARPSHTKHAALCFPPLLHALTAHSKATPPTPKTHPNKTAQQASPSWSCAAAPPRRPSSASRSRRAPPAPPAPAL